MLITMYTMCLGENELCDVPCHHLHNIESYFKFKKNDLNHNRTIKCVGIKAIGANIESC